MRVLLTGSSGFLGKSIQAALQMQDVVTIGRSANHHINCDLANEIPVFRNTFNMVVHCAGKAHTMPKNPEERQAFFDVNVKGTDNLLQSLTEHPPQFFVLISSVSVYGLTEGINIDESTALLAKDPYGLSKIQAEQQVLDWCAKNSVKCSVLRLPLIVGENPPGNLGTMIKGIQKGYYVNIAGGKAKKSMVLATDVAAAIVMVAAVGGIYNLTDGRHPSFLALSSAIAKHFNQKKPINLPYWPIKILALFGDVIGSKFPINSQKLAKLTADLTFSDQAAILQFNWKAKSVLSLYQNHPPKSNLSK